jgi:ubiquinone/menaquinone biosynthesis C-methylase UbiE
MTYNFDRVSDRYDATRAMPYEVAEQICEWVLARLPEDPAVAEIGVGTGRIALPFIMRNIRYVGFDISEQMVGVLRAKLGGNLRRAQILMADVTESLPVPDQSQDAVVAVHILHLVDATRALHQVRRILKPGGALIWGYEAYDDKTPRHRIREKVREVATELGAPADRDFNVPEGRRLLAEWGAHHSRHEVVSWAATESCREVIDRILDKDFSFTWSIPDSILREAMARAEAWARAEYGDLDRPREITKRFIVDWYQF